MLNSLREILSWGEPVTHTKAGFGYGQEWIVGG